jgi:hypothetical protein
MFLPFDILEIDRIDHFGFIRVWAGQIGCEPALAGKMCRQIGQCLYRNNCGALDEPGLGRILERNITVSIPWVFAMLTIGRTPSVCRSAPSSPSSPTKRARSTWPQICSDASSRPTAIGRS